MTIVCIEVPAATAASLAILTAGWMGLVGFGGALWPSRAGPIRPGRNGLAAPGAGRLIPRMASASQRFPPPQHEGVVT